ncbi:MAG: ribosome assembly RNA-binding protein YhbY [Deltaproteobacteria bacterium]|nr:ribosome assembly RNA-binding protein YhbY [Deltaproteobacteria bacterium]
MPAVALTGKQRRHLRGLGHNLSPVVQIGKEGLSDSVVQAIDEALETHELIKVRIGQNALLDRNDVGASLAKETGSEVAQVLGNTVLLYRRHPEEPKIRLP